MTDNQLPLSSRFLSYVYFRLYVCSSTLGKLNITVYGISCWLVWLLDIDICKHNFVSLSSVSPRVFKTKNDQYEHTHIWANPFQNSLTEYDTYIQTSSPSSSQAGRYIPGYDQWAGEEGHWYALLTPSPNLSRRRRRWRRRGRLTHIIFLEKTYLRIDHGHEIVQRAQRNWAIRAKRLISLIFIPSCMFINSLSLP